MKDEQIRETFNRLDINKDGYLSNDELMIGFAKVNLEEEKKKGQKEELWLYSKIPIESI